MSREPVSAARRVALEVLQAVREDDAYANLLLPARIRRAELTAQDAGFATELCYGTLRMRGLYDAIIALAAERDVSRVDPPVLDIVRLGCHQLLGMRVASHAAVNESVGLAHRVSGRGAAGFCNAVLRKIASATLEEWRSRAVAGIRGRDDELAIVYSHPRWVVRALTRALEADGRTSGIEELLAADNEAPAVDLVALPGVAAPPAQAAAARYSPFGFTSGGGDPSGLLAESRGGIRVQDQGSQLAALALSRARGIEPGELWLDLCAGPGGKAALLAAEAADGGARLVANELAPVRADLAREALAGVPGAAEVTTGDGREIGDREPGRFDRVLLDAPCTGLGALRRRPEARWRKRPADVAELTVLQAQLLDSAVRALRPGGVLAYVTCSPHIAETRLVIGDALDRWGPVLRPLDTSAVLHEVAGGDDGSIRGRQVQLWPHLHGTDAMFIALLERTGR